MTNAAGTPKRAGSGIYARIAASQGLLLPWGVAFVLAILVAVFAPISLQWDWYAAAAGICLIVTFIVQLIIGRSDGFLLRTATASLGCVLLLGIVSLIESLLGAVATGLQMFPAA
ncbi:hypothetical protein [Microbacterium sp. G2-8]|uniref:hypothetical protein n=1 Tax=Microbacterium sp. G2-8 TaxID=2842454 RepID=UPI001C897826|nr:hypothetical protein [Microbacterium sp. G2-8]